MFVIIRKRTKDWIMIALSMFMTSIATPAVSWSSFEEAIHYYGVPKENDIYRARTIINENISIECGVQDTGIDTVAEKARRAQIEQARQIRIKRVKEDKSLAGAIGFFILNPENGSIFEISSAIDLLLASGVKDSKKLVLTAYRNAEKVAYALKPGGYPSSDLVSARKALARDIKVAIYWRVAEKNDPYFKDILAKKLKFE